MFAVSADPAACTDFWAAAAGAGAAALPRAFWNVVKNSEGFFWSGEEDESRLCAFVGSPPAKSRLKFQ